MTTITSSWHQDFGKSLRGQSIILAMGIMLVASVMLFLVFNSGRAVNEKINLVNAADAAAYSGAQIAARQLNFMAYTNRAMIANEVAIGHVFSYQMEMDLLGQIGEQAFAGAADNPLIQLILAIIDLFVSGDFSEVVNNSLETIGDAVSILTDVTEGISAVYALSVDANNAFYSSLQQEAFRDFAYPSEGRPLVEVAMQSVVKDYEMRPTAPILLNDPDTLAYFSVNGATPGTIQAAQQAQSMQAAFCQMVLFARPGNGAGATAVGVTNDMLAFCASVLAGGGGTSGAGSPASPVDDGGAMLSMLRTTVSNFSNADWIQDRQANYNLVPLFPVSRSGATEVYYENGHINWRSTGDRLRVSFGIGIFSIPLMTATTSGDAATLSEGLGGTVSTTLINMIQSYGMCGDDTDVDCDSLQGGVYDGVQSYAYLNPGYTNPRVTAFLSQQKCGDNIGVDEDGNQQAGWHNNLRYLETKRDICEGEVYAVSQAEVFFERPACEGGASCSYGFAAAGYDNRNFAEKPNLFNPFWQARIVPAQD